MSSYVSKSTISSVPEDPDNVYLDLLMTNIKGNRHSEIPINYNENRSNSILSNTGDYVMSVVRFNVDTQTLPVFIPEIEPNQGNVNLTTYSVTLVARDSGGVIQTVQQSVEWEPQNIYAPVPPAPNATTDLHQADSPYYYCYNLDWFARLVSKALRLATTTLQASSSFPLALSTMYDPVMTYDPMTKAFILSANQAVFCDVTLGTGVSNTPAGVGTANATPVGCDLYFNTQLFELVSTFSARHYGDSATNGKNFRISFPDFGGSNVGYVPTITDSVRTSQQAFIQVFQEFSTLANITPIGAIVFTSATIPVNPTHYSAPQLVSEGSIQNLAGNAGNFALVLTDLEAGDLMYKPNLLYNPSAEYRRISLMGNGPLSNIQVSVLWKDKKGKLHPLTISGGGSMSMKILFQKVKAIYNPDKDIK